jgi:D-alanyl-D-alanine carboxypeptidase/D-alanyl-D-alanine-endopeptidase (penicillin-binding protein 4)
MRPASLAAPHPGAISNTEHRTPDARTPDSSLTRRLLAISARYLGTPYRRDPLGEGPSGRVDRDPLICASCVDCQTFVEQVLAEALAARPDEVLPLLIRIRYRDGVVGFGTRNHFMVSDWLPHNRWLIRDLTGPVGGRAAREMEKVIDRAAFFRARGAPELGQGIPPERDRTLYIPRAALPAVAPRIPDASVLIWVQDRPGIIAAHCGFAVRRADGRLGGG